MSSGSISSWVDTPGSTKGSAIRPTCPATTDSQGLLNNNAVTDISFDPRKPHHFLASFADSIILQFDLFAEDPATTVMASNMPWQRFFDSAEDEANLEPMSPLAETPSKMLADLVPDSAPTHVNGEKSVNGNGPSTSDTQAPDGTENEDYEDRMLIWKNEDYGQVPVEKTKKTEQNISPWAGKNPIAAIKVGLKPLSCRFRPHELCRIAWAVP